MRFSPQYSFQSQGVLNPQPSGFAFLSAGFFFCGESGYPKRKPVTNQAKYRRLHRLGIPFAAGVLHENDLDTPAAQALASRVILEAAFEPIGQDKTDLALSLIEQCQYVLCPLDAFGTMNRANAALCDAAEKAGKLAADVRETER